MMKFLSLLLVVFIPLIAAVQTGGYADGVTGGAGGRTVRVRSTNELINALNNKDSRPLTIEVSGELTHSSARITIDDVRDLTIKGPATFKRFGLRFRNGRNIILQDLKIYKAKGVDCIGLEGTKTVWVDHCTLYSDTDNGKDYYDGLLDITKGSDKITISWTYFRDHYKALLIGASDSDTSDKDNLRVTLHHNRFRRLNSRVPSVRFGRVHVYNNFYEDCNNAVNTRMGAIVRLDRNVFSNTNTAVTSSGSKDKGYVDIRSGNDFGGARVESLSSRSLSISYSFDLHRTSDVRSIVRPNAGCSQCP